MKAKQRRRRWWLPPVLIVTGVVGTGWWLNYSSAKALEVQVERARKLGMIVTQEDMNALKPADPDNAFFDYEAAYKDLQKLPKATNSILRNGWTLLRAPNRARFTRTMLGRSNLVTWPEVLEIARSAKSVFQRIKVGNEKTSFFDPEFRTEGIKRAATDLTFACAIAAEAEAEAGNYDLAIEYLKLGRGMSEKLYGFPSLLKVIQGCALDQIVEATLRRIVLEIKFPDDLDRFAEFAIQSASPSIKTALQSEPLSTIDGIDMVAKDPAVWNEDTWRDFEYWRMGSLRLGWIGNGVKMRTTRAFMRAYSNLSNDPNDLAYSAKVAQEIASNLRTDGSYAGSLADKVVANYDSLFEGIAKTALARRLDAAFIEICRAKLETGGYPAALPASAKKFLDPMTGKPFLYRRRADGFVLYAVGLNGVDDGGDPAVKKGDVALIVAKGQALLRY